MQNNTSHNIDKLCQYMEAKRNAELLRKIFLQGFVKPHLLFLILSKGNVGIEAWTSAASPDIVGCCVLLGASSYCLKYHFLD